MNATAHIDALAVGPYFGSYSAQRDTTLDKFLQETLPMQVSWALRVVLGAPCACMQRLQKPRSKQAVQRGTRACARDRVPLAALLPSVCPPHPPPPPPPPPAHPHPPTPTYTHTAGQAIEAHGMVRPHAEVAAQHGKQLVAYKAGQGIGGVDGTARSRTGRRRTHAWRASTRRVHVLLVMRCCAWARLLCLGSAWSQ